MKALSDQLDALFLKQIDALRWRDNLQLLHLFMETQKVVLICGYMNSNTTFPWIIKFLLTQFNQPIYVHNQLT